MIIVSGLNRETGQIRKNVFLPGCEGLARKFRALLRDQGYTTAFVNEVKERYRMERARSLVGSVPKREEVFTCEGVSSYQLHSLGTGSGNMKGKHIAECETNFADDAIEQAETRIAKWSDSHKGIVIYKAVKLVRKTTKPTTEIIDL